MSGKSGDSSGALVLQQEAFAFNKRVLPPDRQACVHSQILYPKDPISNPEFRGIFRGSGHSPGWMYTGSRTPDDPISNLEFGGIRDPDRPNIRHIDE